MKFMTQMQLVKTLRAYGATIPFPRIEDRAFKLFKCTFPGFNL